jgi:hypothetical protein
VKSIQAAGFSSLMGVSLVVSVLRNTCVVPDISVGSSVSVEKGRLGAGGRQSLPKKIRDR